MSSKSWNRRTFLKAMGLGGAGSALLLSGCGNTDIIDEVDLEVRKEKVETSCSPASRCTMPRPAACVLLDATCMHASARPAC